MATFEIRDEEINVEDIMCQIRENIKKRKDSGTYTKEMETLINKPFPPPRAEEVDFQPDLNYINSNWDVHVEYNINSHRPILGQPLVLGRRLIHGEVKRYVDLIVEKQIEFNAHVAWCIRGIVAKINEDVASIQRSLDEKINEVVAAVNSDIEKKTWLASLLEKRIKRDITTPSDNQIDEVMNYFLFEEKHRGSTKDIKRRQSIFLDYFKTCKNVLDMGCGRGEFLSLLKENGIGAKGIDINEDMVLYCQKNGLDVQKADVLSYLQSIENKSLDGVFSSQVIEHLQPEKLICLVKQCYDKMKYGTYFIAETINPLCLSTYALFSVDLSHVRPIHPETIKFLLESVGFREIQFKFLSPHPDDGKLKKLVITDGMSCKEKAQLHVINQNIDRLNSLLFGYQDYAVIAKK